jgi:hypothetical protein
MSDDTPIKPITPIKPKSTAETVSGNVAKLDDVNTFTLEWADLKSTMLSVIDGNKPPLKILRNATRFEDFLTSNKDKRWRGFSAAEVKRWLVEGYQLDGLQFDNPPIPIREKRRLEYKEEGEEFHIDLAYDGEDSVFSEWTKREVIPGLAVECEYTFSSATSHETLRDYFQFICRALYALEQAGIDLDVTLSNTVRKLYPDNSTRYQRTTIRVKKENEASDFHTWSAMLSPASLRAFGFCAGLIDADSRGYEAHHAMGYADVPGEWGVAWKPEEEKLVFSVTPHRSQGFPAQKMESDLRNALAAMSSSPV